MNDQLTTRLTRQLHEQVDGMTDAPLSLDDVRGRAHAIRRTRRLAAAGVAAVAVAAIALPIGLLGGDGAGRGDRPPVVDTPSEAVDPTPRADGTFPLTLDVPEGPVPDTGYIVFGDQTYVTPDRTLDLPGSFVQIAPYDEGWVGIRASRSSPTGHEVVVLDADLEEVSASPSGPGLAPSSDGTRVAWLDVEGGGGTGTLVNAPADGGQPIYTSVSSRSQIEGFLSPELVAVSLFDDTSGDTSYRGAGPNGWDFEEPSLAGFQAVGGISEVAGLVAGQTQFRGDSTCSEVRRTDPAQPGLVHETCDHQLGAFSPDGQLLLGFPTYFDLGSPALAVLDAATGEPVVEWTSSPRREDAAMVMSAVWEDDDTVVAVVEQGRNQQVLRFELNGSVTKSGEALPSQMSIEYFLPGDLDRQ
ncbi:hypothetical protein [Nocardioides euryhalodurans]|uniref:WD40 repeat domain-containing protein n=1 Tax=Nocardioides euryhalodurans TaxID=2518370 RepID=A0A4P7GNU2_9ACTN|nr:hypothetical protein [Nocardioides euryhalodurans]QBR93594.1 hypothetical protein EXE57_15920 [Nocardioides euryhalodurans]